MRSYTFLSILVALFWAVWNLFSKDTLDITVTGEQFTSAVSFLSAINPSFYYLTKNLAVRISSALGLLPSLIGNDLTYNDIEDQITLKHSLYSLFKLSIFIVLIIYITMTYNILSSGNEVPVEDNTPRNVNRGRATAEVSTYTPSEAFTHTPSEASTYTRTITSVFPLFLDDFRPCTDSFAPFSSETTDDRKPLDPKRNLVSKDSSNFGCSKLNFFDEPKISSPSAVIPCSYVSVGEDTEEEEGPEKLMQMFWAPDDPRLKIELSPPIYSPPCASASPKRSCFKGANDNLRSPRVVQFIKKPQTFYIETVVIPSPPPLPKTKMPKAPANYARNHDAIRVGLYFNTRLPVPSRCLASRKFHYKKEEE